MFTKRIQLGCFFFLIPKKFKLFYKSQLGLTVFLIAFFCFVLFWFVFFVS